MLFSSLIFIWYFLPVVFLIVYILKPLKWSNAVLLAASLFFYAWGEPKYIFLMMLSIGMNYIFGLLVDKCQKDQARLWITSLCIVLNLAILGYFKYFNFFISIINQSLGQEWISVRDIALPVGISFYTFQALSYVVDVHRRKIKVQTNLWDLALYISFFPQLIAGPIVKYHEIEEQLSRRDMTGDKICYGLKRFTYGLGKKVIFANTFAAVVDTMLEPSIMEQMSTGLTWFVLLLYTLQIYYDFSGYSDMAIGLGKMFGFDFMENFNYPYLSASIKEFWRRWHISLSTWFREYLYIPLGGNRKGEKRTYINLFAVFLVTGLWHGAGLNFILWGAYYGVFIVAERLFLGDLLEKNRWKPVNHIYTMFVVMTGWMLFRMESLSEIKHMVKVLFLGQGGVYTIPMYVDGRILFFTVLGIFLCGPLQCFKPVRLWLYEERHIYWRDIFCMSFVLIISTVLLVSNTYNPFIYFRF